MKKENDGKLSIRESDGLLAEYNSLRSEILKRIEIRNSIVFGTITFAGVLLSFGLTTPTLALLYIIISMFLAAAWVHNDVTISSLGRYIREHLEHLQTGLQWETFRQRQRIAGTQERKLHPTAVFSTSGVYLITQVVALIIAFSKFQIFTVLDWVLSAAAIACILLTVYLFRYSSKNNE